MTTVIDDWILTRDMRVEIWDLLNEAKATLKNMSCSKRQRQAVIDRINEVMGVTEDDRLEDMPPSTKARISVKDQWKDIIRKWALTPEGSKHRYVNVNYVALHALNLPKDALTAGDRRKISAALGELGWKSGTYRMEFLNATLEGFARPVEEDALEGI